MRVDSSLVLPDRFGAEFRTFFRSASSQLLASRASCGELVITANAVQLRNAVALIRHGEKTRNGSIPATRTSVTISHWLFGPRVFLLALCLASVAQAQSPPDAPVPVVQQANSQPPLSPQEKAALQLKQQEQQRIAGVVPNFNVSYNKDAIPLTRKQKLRLAWRTATDPVAFGIAGFDAAFSQAENDFPGYGQGAQGYAKRFGASYADNFDGTLLGNAIFPILLKQDPRYFRRGEGSFPSRLFYALSTTIWCKNDNGKWGPNYSNILGNLTAGGISNLYYPASDRGAGLTLERGFTVTAYGAFGGVFNEFWPDIARKIFKDKMAKLQPRVPPPATTIAAPPPQ
jgi:hypothetical protein